MSTPHDKTMRTPTPETPVSPAPSEAPQPTSSGRRALLKKTAWVVPAVIACGPVPSMAAKQSTGRAPAPDQMPPDVLP